MTDGPDGRDKFQVWEDMCSSFADGFQGLMSSNPAFLRLQKSQQCLLVTTDQGENR